MKHFFRLENKLNQSGFETVGGLREIGALSLCKERTKGSREERGERREERGERREERGEPPLLQGQLLQRIKIFYFKL